MIIAICKVFIILIKLQSNFLLKILIFFTLILMKIESEWHKKHFAFWTKIEKIDQDRIQYKPS